jgi:uncharacterized protein YbcI
MTEQDTAATQERDGPVDSALLKMSNEMVRIYKDQFGRGPTKTRSDWAGPDALLCTLRETFTPAEKNLAEMGEYQRLRDVRLFFQYAIEDDFVGTAERVVGRKVVGFVSGIDVKHDVASELFYFEPRRSA